MKRLALIFAFLCLFALPAAAQIPTNYVLKSYSVGATVPVSTFGFLASAVVCNQAPPVAGTSTVNPTRVVWDDPTLAGRDCIWTDPGTGPLFSLPIGNYEATLAAVNTVGSSVDSVRAPFSKQSAPATPTGLQLLR